MNGTLRMILHQQAFQRVEQKKGLWWNEECKNTIKERNHAFRILIKHLSQDNLIDYQRKKARARRQFCSSIGCEVQIGDIWSMIKKMSGKRKSVNIPVLRDGEYTAITKKEKADLLGKKLQLCIVEIIWMKCINREKKTF